MWLFVVTIFLSAWLLFAVQPLIGKFLLPWFGGTSSVWTTCMVFFQVLLLGGYSYAHLLTTRLNLRRQVLAHVALLVLVSAVLIGQHLAWGVPLLPGSSWKPPDIGDPVGKLILVLAVSVGLPFFVLASTSPLLQSWYGRRRPGRAPYHLYAVSNAGSLLGLLSYPLVVEPFMRLAAQGRMWSIAFAGFAACCATVGLGVLWRNHLVPPGGPVEGPPAAASPLAEPATAGLHDTARDDLPPDAARYLLWILLPACGSVLLLATSNKITDQIASFPLLWVLPLSLYLLSFILSFARIRFYHRGGFGAGALVSVALLLATDMLLAQRRTPPMTLEFGRDLLALGVACMICHGEFARLKPAARHLTAYYLCLSLGGVLGGLFVSLAAPVLFDRTYELTVGYLGCAALLMVVMVRDRRSAWHGRWRRGVQAAGLVAMALVAIDAIMPLLDTSHEVVRIQRNFYGIVSVHDQPLQSPLHGVIRTQSHGRTVHGLQATDPTLRREPTTYYGRSGGLGIAISSWPKWQDPDTPVRIGVVGLGAGTIAAYGRPNDFIKFYEINPAVIEMAAGPQACFTFIQDSPAEVTIAPGDARLEMEKELRAGLEQRFDLLVLDAFSGDAVPTHLLTKEALAVYLEHLNAGGMLAFHVSNRFMNLPLAVLRVAAEHRLAATVIVKNLKGLSLPSVWVLMSRDPHQLTRREILAANVPMDRRFERTSLWTDDYSNFMQLLRVGDEMPFFDLLAPPEAIERHPDVEAPRR